MRLSVCSPVRAHSSEFDDDNHQTLHTEKKRLSFKMHNSPRIPLDIDLIEVCKLLLLLLLLWLCGTIADERVERPCQLKVVAVDTTTYDDTSWGRVTGDGVQLLNVDPPRRTHRQRHHHCTEVLLQPLHLYTSTPDTHLSLYLDCLCACS